MKRLPLYLADRFLLQNVLVIITLKFCPYLTSGMIAHYKFEMESVEEKDKSNPKRALSLISVFILLNIVGLWVVLLSHDHDLYYAKDEHVHDYADMSHSHEYDSWFGAHLLDYADRQHSHKSDSWFGGHSHDYAEESHQHHFYSPQGHTHEYDYWFDGHDHDLDYSRMWHSHDLEYSPKRHSH